MTVKTLGNNQTLIYSDDGIIEFHSYNSKIFRYDSRNNSIMFYSVNAKNCEGFNYSNTTNKYLRIALASCGEIFLVEFDSREYDTTKIEKMVNNR